MIRQPSPHHLPVVSHFRLTWWCTPISCHFVSYSHYLLLCALDTQKQRDCRIYLYVLYNTRVATFYAHSTIIIVGEGTRPINLIVYTRKVFLSYGGHFVYNCCFPGIISEDCKGFSKHESSNRTVIKT